MGILQMPTLTRLAPELPAENLDASLAFYEKQLGFKVKTLLPDQGYAIVERDGVAIHLFADDTHSRAGLHLFTHELEPLHDELLLRGVRVSQPIERKPWGNRDFRVVDPAGNELKFTEPLGMA
jgi:uncharacterized glyoxalase superfamily protein PhnB